MKEIKEVAEIIAANNGQLSAEELEMLVYLIEEKGGRDEFGLIE